MLTFIPWVLLVLQKKHPLILMVVGRCREYAAQLLSKGVRVLGTVRYYALHQYPGNVPPPKLSMICFVLNLQILRN